MAILVVLLILVLGYRYAESVPYERVKLKRSDGWEAYVYLAKNGLVFVTIAAIIIAAILLLFFGIEYFLYKYDLTLYLDKTYKNISLTKMTTNNIGILAAIVPMSFFVCSRIALWKKSDNWRAILRKEDSILNLIIEAMDEVKEVKISLTSRKVYVGLIQSEQFESADLDNIVIIPYMSGYRDKDKLRLEFDCNYISVYRKNGLIPVEPTEALNKEHMEKLNSFKLVIKMGEIESISLFDPSYYEQFEFEESKEDIVSSNNQDNL